MNKTTIDRRETSFFSNTANSLVYNQEQLTPFISTPFSKENLFNQIKKKADNYNNKYRIPLVEVLIESYQNIENKTAVVENTILLEQKDTFTITTGHQLNLFTGPVFFVYKILHVIKLAAEMKAKHPEYNFVPVYWMASEDHDFEEINHLSVFNNKVVWNTDQKGAVGRFEIKAFEETKSALLSYFENQVEIAAWIKEQYLNGESLSQATLRLVHGLFGDKGLLIIDADHPKLKTLFKPVLFKEVQASFSQKAVSKTSLALEKEGYKTQVHPREINLFFLDENSRERIVKKEDGTFEWNNFSCNAIELLEMMDLKPQDFSPNVVLRPVYQEWILPNLCYVGGGGEMAYWLQLKGVFDALELSYPIIQVRNSVQFVDATNASKMDKLGYSFVDFLKDKEELKKDFVLSNSKEEISFEILEEHLNTLSNQITSQAIEVESGLKGYAEAEVAKLNKQIKQFEDKLTRHQKKKFDDSLKQIEGVYKRLFPNNGLQERTENVLQFFSKYGFDSFVNDLYDQIDPWEKNLIVITD